VHDVFSEYHRYWSTNFLKTDSCGCPFSFIIFFRVVFLCYDYWGHLFRSTTVQSLFFCGSSDYRFCFITFPRLFAVRILVYYELFRRSGYNEMNHRREDEEPWWRSLWILTWWRSIVWLHFLWKYFTRTVSVVIYNAVYSLRVNNYCWIWCTGKFILSVWNSMWLGFVTRKA